MSPINQKSKNMNQNNVEIIKGPFPGFEEVKKEFPDIEEKNTVFAFGNKIYIPHKVGEDIIAHEMVHCRRQGYTEDGAKDWWIKYYEDNNFRFNEELIAYKAQYQFFKQYAKNNDRETLWKYGMNLAAYLTGPLYKNMADLNSCYKQITS